MDTTWRRTLAWSFCYKFNDTYCYQEGLNGSVAEWLEKVSDEHYALKSN